MKRRLDGGILHIREGGVGIIYALALALDEDGTRVDDVGEARGGFRENLLFAVGGEALDDETVAVLFLLVEVTILIEIAVNGACIGAIFAVDEVGVLAIVCAV